MPLLRITAAPDRLHLADGTDGHWRAAVRRGIEADPGPVTVMVHGYKYLPGHPAHCPHTTLQADRPCRRDPRIISWPRHLGLRGQPGAGLGISFGWHARGSIWAAHRRAAEAGHRLAALLAEVRRADPDRPVHILAHSLGARVTLSAIDQGAPGTVTRAVLLASAEFAGIARTVLHSPQGRDTQILNVTSRENDLFDFVLETLVPAPEPGERMLGYGDLRLENLVTLQLDAPRSLAALRAAGYTVAHAQRAVCHWSPYLRAGAFPLYRAFLSGTLPLHRLGAILPPQTAPRWSRIAPGRLQLAALNPMVRAAR